MDKLFKELCLEVASGDIGSDRFNRLWIQSGIPLEGWEFEVANLILVKAAQETIKEETVASRSMH